jgi:hypothetical protein
MIEYYESHNMVVRIQKLFANHGKLSDDQLRQRLEKWDQDQGRAMRNAEKSLQQMRPQKHLWSPTLRNAGLLCWYWQLRLYGLRKRRDMHQTINRLQDIIRQHDMTCSFPMRNTNVSESDLLSKWNMAKKDLKTCQANARELRYKSYAELLAIYEMDPSPESQRKSKIVASTIRTEKCREMFRQIRISARPFQENSGGLSSVMIPRITNLSPDQDDSSQPITLDIYKWLAEQPHGPSQWDTIIERSEMENHLLKFNHASFRAASASPCGQGVIMDALTFSSMSPAGHSFLRGIVPPEWHGQDALAPQRISNLFYRSR